MGDLVTKTKVVPFLNIGTTAAPSWLQLKKTTAFTLSLNPQVKTFDFISSETPQEEVDSYQPSLSQSLVMFKGEDDYETIFNMLYELPTGEKAKKEALIVFYQESGTDSENKEVFKAWKLDALVKLNQMDSVNETIDFDLSFSNRKTGAVSVTTSEDGTKNVTFTSGKWSKSVFTQD